MLPYYHNFLWAFPTSSWLNEFSSQMCKCETTRISFSLYIYFFFQQSQVCMGSIRESKLKSKISHSLIHMGFIRLVTWSGVRGLWKKGLERLKECLRVTLSKNLGSIACTFWVGLKECLRAKLVIPWSMFLIVFFLFYFIFYINPNFCLGLPFRFST